MAKRKRQSTTILVPDERIEQGILLIRDQKVMLDEDLAEIYGVTTKRLNEQVKRNLDRFPADFMFQLSKEEYAQLRSQFATSRWGGRRYPPFAFTEHGTVMLASVLNSPVAVQASIQVVRAFIRLREIMATHKELARKLSALEKKYDERFQVVFEAIRKLMESPSGKPKRKIGFHSTTDR
jgi:phage regulator Rha-like protein